MAFRLLPGRRRAPHATTEPNAMVAAAIVTPRQLSTAKAGAGQWQQQAWDHYDICGELRYGAGWLGSALSRTRLTVARLDPDDADADPEPLDDAGEAGRVLAAFGGGQSGQSQILKLLAIHLTVAGDCYVVGWDDPILGPGGTPTGETEQRWVVRAPTEIMVQGDRISIKLDGQEHPLPEENVLLRVWRPHPRYSWQADSPARGLLQVLHMIERLQQKMLAQINSRLAGAGILFLPSEFDFPAPPPPPPSPDGQEPAPRTRVQQFVDTLQSAMVTPILNREDPSSVVPIVVTGPADAIDKAKLLTFWSDADDKDSDRLDRAIKRLALGMDVPAEILLGMGDMSHWNAWQVDDAAIKLHVEPLLGLVCDALTEGFLRPALGSDADDLVVWYDASPLKQKPNRGPDALQLYDRRELGGGTLRREYGFDDADAPDSDELRLRTLQELATQAGSQPDIAERVIDALHLLPESSARPAEGQTRQEGEATSGDPTGGVSATPPVSTPSGVGRSARTGPPPEPADRGRTPAALARRAAPPDRAHSRPVAPPRTASADSDGGWGTAAHVLAAHGLDYAGRRWVKGQPRSVHRQGVTPARFHETLPVPPDRLDFCLAGVWDGPWSHTTPQRLLAAVDGYVRDTLATGQPHNADRLGSAVGRVMADASA